MIKQALKQITPPILWNVSRQLFHRLRGSPDNKQQDPLENAHRKNNEGLDADTILLRPGIKLKIHPDSRKAFEYFCYISPPMVVEMDLFMEAVKTRERLLDIGALHGIFSLVFAALSTNNKVLAVDASPMAFAHLLYNIHKNNFTSIKPIECAVSDNIGTLTMHYEWEHAVAAGTNLASNTIHVPMKTGDLICSMESFRPDVIKIDVEGHEIKVLKGLAETIKNNSPLIFLEVHPERIQEEGDSISFLESFFRELDYSAQIVAGGTFRLSSFRNLRSTERFLLSKKTEMLR